ncbi:MAG: hypothetical protein ACXWKC_17715 [Xanthobacteraceae bacterium]
MKHVSKILVGASIAGAIAFSTIAPASAAHRNNGAAIAAGVIGGLALGAAATAPYYGSPYYAPGYYAAPPVAYGYEYGYPQTYSNSSGDRLHNSVGNW